MRSLPKVLVAVAVGALVAPALAGAAQTPVLRGTVVQRDAKAGVVVVANKSGKLTRVKVAKPNKLAMGSVLRIAGTKVTVVGHTHRAKLHGVVVRRHVHSFALAGNGSVLAVASPAPPAAGAQVTTTVQVTPNALDDNGHAQVNDDQVPNAELRGTVATLDATSIGLTVAGFPDGLTIAIGTVVLPSTVTVGTSVEVHVTLAPIPGNPAAVSLTLVSIHVEDDENDNEEHHHGGQVKAEGIVTELVEAGALGGENGLITIMGEHGSVTFVIPAGFGPSGVMVKDKVEARGTPGTTLDTQPTLTRLETKSDNSGPGNGGDDDDDGGGGHSGHGSGGDD
jgi:hypothetical protein